ncbi:hypothetical protein [Leptolyngbya sp. FACHB-261]|uniref:hypothetical protein n=1 Tax=Leptolyngbya sp. FACHB-261 TaxID=2692806 RepID=UPI001689F596|nr:hypothetical protein [Leptolyngbya sp. FACHB-261]MBD2105073.1 hypothetical protein [Leptolyngbya sp. FACHB-261]
MSDDALMPDDALERLMQRKRPSARSRPSAGGSEPLAAPLTAPKAETPELPPALPQSAASLPELGASLLDWDGAAVNLALRQLWQATGTTEAAWLEAAYLYLVQHPEALQAVNQLALQREERQTTKQETAANSAKVERATLTWLD